jgi:ABC-type nitrate/sulfonate/bicarbonate transport system ATPase subunit
MKIEIKNLEFSYDNSMKVIDNINLSLSDSNITAIVGASGCGKSTFLGLIAGIIKKTKENYLSGEIFINSLQVSDYHKNSIIGFMFQDPVLFPNLTVFENIILPLEIRRILIKDDVEKIIKLVGLDKFKNYLPSKLSGGMKTRVALAREFVSRPELLLLDEPFSSLDIRWKYYLYNELEKLRLEYHPMVIMVTHDIQEALLLSDHVVIMGRNGKILKDFFRTKAQVIPKATDFKNVKNVQEEYLEIQSYILNDTPPEEQ